MKEIWKERDFTIRSILFLMLLFSKGNIEGLLKSFFILADQNSTNNNMHYHPKSKFIDRYKIWNNVKRLNYQTVPNYITFQNYCVTQINKILISSFQLLDLQINPLSSHHHYCCTISGIIQGGNLATAHAKLYYLILSWSFS